MLASILPIHAFLIHLFYKAKAASSFYASRGLVTRRGSKESWKEMAESKGHNGAARVRVTWTERRKACSGPWQKVAAWLH